MAEERNKNQAAPAEKLIDALFRLLQAVRIHQANNKIFQSSLDDFNEVLGRIWAEADAARLRIRRGRFYLNDVRVVYSSGLWGTAVKLIERLQGLRLAGLTLNRREGPLNEETINLPTLLDQARRQADPYAWLKAEGRLKCPWVEFPEDEDAGLAFADARPEEEGNHAAAGPNSIWRRSSSQAQAALARQAYSHALTTLQGLSDKLRSHKRAGLQKAKRALQELVEILKAEERIILILSTIRRYDDQIYTHSLNVALLVMALGRRLDLPWPEIEYLGLAGLFHDLGKLDLPPELLAKPGPLSVEEEAQARKHAPGGARRLIRLNANHQLKGRLLRPIFEHHAAPDEAGRPALSLFSRIVAMADQFDALTSCRPYRPEPLSPAQALADLRAGAGRNLDPLVLKPFADMLGPWPVGSLLLLDDGRCALSAGPVDETEGRPLARHIFEQNGRTLAGDYLDLTEKDESGRRYRLDVKATFHPSLYGLQPVDYLL